MKREHIPLMGFTVQQNFVPLPAFENADDANVVVCKAYKHESTNHVGRQCGVTRTVCAAAVYFRLHATYMDVKNNQQRSQKHVNISWQQTVSVQ